MKEETIRIVFIKNVHDKTLRNTYVLRNKFTSAAIDWRPAMILKKVLITLMKNDYRFSEFLSVCSIINLVHPGGHTLLILSLKWPIYGDKWGNPLTS